jgi:hypothetical protein
MMIAKTDLSPSTGAGEPDPISTLVDGGGTAPRKPEFIKPKVTSHGHLVDLTAPFGGSVNPRH